MLFFMGKLSADTDHDFQSWFNLTLTGDFDEKSRDFGRFKYWLEGQERVGDDSSRVSQALGRVGIGYAVTENTSLWLGYAFIHTSTPFTNNPFNENRIWEQLLWSKKLKNFNLHTRTRLEQRFFSNRTKTDYRARQLIKLIKPLDSLPNYSLICSDEIFWHKNNILEHNNQGFDQNRFFIGFGYQFSPVITTEIGYMNQYLRRVAIPDFLNNILSLNLFVNF